MMQLMPEAMDLFIAGVEDRPGVALPVDGLDGAAARRADAAARDRRARGAS